MILLLFKSKRAAEVASVMFTDVFLVTFAFPTQRLEAKESILISSLCVIMENAEISLLILKGTVIFGVLHPQKTKEMTIRIMRYSLFINFTPLEISSI